MGVKLTQRMVDKLEAPAKGSRLVWDDVVRGLVVRITEHGAKSYVFAYRLHGLESRLTIGKSDGNRPEWSLERARQKAEAWRVMVNDGKDPKQEREEERKKVEQ